MRRLAFALIAAMMLSSMADATPKVPRQGSYFIVNPVDDSTGRRMENFTVRVSMEFPGENSKLSYSYEANYSGDDKVWISMPPKEYGAVAKITLSGEGYSGSNEETMTSQYYWDNVGKKDHLADFDFRVKSASGGFCCFPGLTLVFGMLAAAAARLL